MDGHMSDVEALMWNLEKDPHLASTFANVTILDRAPDLDRLRRRMERALRIVPRLRQKVVPGFGRLAPPRWVEDPDIDLDWHVRRLGLPAPATEREAFDLATTLAAEPFDRTRPLWRFTVLEGLSGGRAAMVQQLHHTITDGEGGVRMSVEFLDLERDAPEPPMPTGEDAGAPPAVAEDLVAAVAGSVGHVARRNLGIVQRAGSGVLGLATHPSRLRPFADEVGDVVSSSLRQVAVRDPARSPLWTERTLRRRLEVLRLPLDDTKRAAKALGGSVNDVFVAAVAGGAGAYHRDRGVDLDALRMAMPVSTRAKGDRASSNAFAPTRTLVSVDDDPEVRFALINEQLHATKGERAIHLAASLAGLANLLPTSVLVRAARNQVETVDFTTSNVRGAPFDLFMAGARIDANYPLGPVAGTAFNATVLSVAGSLDVGIHVDAGAVEDPAALRDAIATAADELLSFG